MEPDELHLADEHNLARRFIVWTCIQIDKTIHLFEFLLTIGRNVYLGNARYRYMVRGLNDAVTLVLCHDTYHGILRTLLPKVF